MIKIGVIGSGKWGVNHIRAYKELEKDNKIKLVGLADIDKTKKSLAEKYGIKFTTDYKELIKEVDAVSIVVPTNYHYQVAKTCLNEEKHILVEKPISTKLKEAEELVNIANKKNLVIRGGYVFRFNAAVKKLKEMLGEVGEINYITMRYIHGNKPPRSDSGVVFNLAVHSIDILLYLLEEKPSSIFAAKTNYLSKEYEDAVNIVLKYNKFFANIEASWMHPLKKRDMWIIGSKNKIYVDLLEQEIYKYPFEIDYNKIPKIESIKVKVNKNEPLKEELKNFYEDIMNKRTNKNNSELPSLKICTKALESSKKKKKIIL